MLSTNQVLSVHRKHVNSIAHQVLCLSLYWRLPVNHICMMYPNDLVRRVVLPFLFLNEETQAQRWPSLFKLMHSWSCIFPGSALHTWPRDQQRTHHTVLMALSSLAACELQEWGKEGVFGLTTHSEFSPVSLTRLCVLWHSPFSSSRKWGPQRWDTQIFKVPLYDTEQEASCFWTSWGPVFQSHLLRLSCPWLSYTLEGL